MGCGTQAEIRGEPVRGQNATVASVLPDLRRRWDPQTIFFGRKIFIWII